MQLFLHIITKVDIILLTPTLKVMTYRRLVLIEIKEIILYLVIAKQH